MNLFDYPLLADENINPRVVEFLRSVGCDIQSITELSMYGASDEDNNSIEALKSCLFLSIRILIPNLLTMPC
jgi:hypothetical protein